MTSNALKNTLLAAALALGSLNAHALESDRQQPISIDADQGSLDQKNQVTVFTGNVIITQGTLNMRANTVRVVQDQNGNQTMNAQGSPVYFRQELDNNKGIAEGWGDRAEYVSASHTVKRQSATRRRCCHRQRHQLQHANRGLYRAGWQRHRQQKQSARAHHHPALHRAER